MVKKSFRVSFPVYATGYDTVDVDEKDLKDKSEEEIKELLLNLLTSPTVCHYCNENVEEIEFDFDHCGENLENVSYWEEK